MFVHLFQFVCSPYRNIQNILYLLTEEYSNSNFFLSNPRAIPTRFTLVKVCLLFIMVCITSTTSGFSKEKKMFLLMMRQDIKVSC